MDRRKRWKQCRPTSFSRRADVSPARDAPSRTLVVNRPSGPPKEMLPKQVIRSGQAVLTDPGMLPIPLPAADLAGTAPARPSWPKICISALMIPPAHGGVSPFRFQPQKPLLAAIFAAPMPRGVLSAAGSRISPLSMAYNRLMVSEPYRRYGFRWRPTGHAGASSSRRHRPADLRRRTGTVPRVRPRPKWRALPPPGIAAERTGCSRTGCWKRCLRRCGSAGGLWRWFAGGFDGDF